MSGSWLQGHLVTIGHHLPAKYPHSPSELLKKSEPKAPMSIQQWSAFASSVLGKPVVLQAPTDAEVRKYG